MLYVSIAAGFARRPIVSPTSHPSSFFFLLTPTPPAALPFPLQLHSGISRLDATREFDKALRQIEKRIEELDILSRSCHLDIASSIQALRAQLDALRKTAHPAAAPR